MRFEEHQVLMFVKCCDLREHPSKTELLLKFTLTLFVSVYWVACGGFMVGVDADDLLSKCDHQESDLFALLLCYIKAKLDLLFVMVTSCLKT